MSYRILSKVEGSTDEGIDSTHIIYLEIETDEVVSSDEELRELKQEINDEWADGCACSHDCCGHWFGGLDCLLPRWSRPEHQNHFIARISYQCNV